MSPRRIGATSFDCKNHCRQAEAMVSCGCCKSGSAPPGKKCSNCSNPNCSKCSFAGGKCCRCWPANRGKCKNELKLSKPAQSKKKEINASPSPATKASPKPVSRPVMRMTFSRTEKSADLCDGIAAD